MTVITIQCWNQDLWVKNCLSTKSLELDSNDDFIDNSMSVKKYISCELFVRSNGVANVIARNIYGNRHY